MAKKPQDMQPEQSKKMPKPTVKKEAKKDVKKDVKTAAKKGKKPSIFVRIKDYFHNVRLEIKRSTWPTKHEVLNMSIIVVVALLFFGILIFLIDQIMVTLLQLYSNIAPDGTFYQSAADASSASSVIDASSTSDASGAIETGSDATEPEGE